MVRLSPLIHFSFLAARSRWHSPFFRDETMALLLCYKNYFSRTNRAQRVEIATSEKLPACSRNRITLAECLSAQCVRFVPARTFSLRILPGDDKLRTASIQARGADWWHVGKLGTKHAEERGRETRVSQTFDDVWRRLTAIRLESGTRGKFLLQWSRVENARRGAWPLNVECFVSVSGRLSRKNPIEYHPSPRVTRFFAMPVLCDFIGNLRGP